MRTHRPDDGGSTDLWNVGKLIPVYTALQPRRQPSSTSKTSQGSATTLEKHRVGPPWTATSRPVCIYFVRKVLNDCCNLYSVCWRNNKFNCFKSLRLVMLQNIRERSGNGRRTTGPGSQAIPPFIFS
jgi:hypothetical protein